jgi:hypothetical protein
MSGTRGPRWTASPPKFSLNFDYFTPRREQAFVGG